MISRQGTGKPLALLVIRVDPHTMQGMRTLILRHQGPPTPHQGLLGLNFLSQCPYSVDMRAKVIKRGTPIPAAGP